MRECGECGADLDPAWKFCIHCGTRVAVAQASDSGPREPSLDGVAPAEPVAAGLSSAWISDPPIPAARSTMPSMLPLGDPPAADSDADSEAALVPPDQPTDIPSAFRIFPSATDDDEHHSADRPKFDLPLVLGISIGAFGLVAVVAAFVIIVGGG